MATFGKRDMAGVLADYAPDAVMFTPGGPIRGTGGAPQGLRAAVRRMGQARRDVHAEAADVDGKNAYIFWDAETADNLYEGAMDAFVVENGKIVAHFFSGKITAKVA